MTDRLRVPLPATGTFPRVGKIRLGTTEEATSSKGNIFQKPSAADHFVVAEDESGITSAEAAAAFRAVYGDEPRELHCMLPGQTPDDVFEGAWRLYGTGKLKIRCDGETCDERSATGAWVRQPCVCKANGISETDKKHHCTLTYTLQVILPDVPGVGVWQCDTGSKMSSERIANWLTLMAFGGSLQLLEFDLRLVPVQVTPDGVTKTVYILHPETRAATPRQMLAAAREGRQLAALPAPAADEHPERTLDRAGFADDEDSRQDIAATAAPVADAQVGARPTVTESDPGGTTTPPSPRPEDAPAASASPPTTPSAEPGEPGGDAPATGDDPQRFLLEAVGAQVKALPEAQKATLRVLCERLGVKPTAQGLVATYGDQAANVDHLITQMSKLVTEMSLEGAKAEPAQGTLA